MHFVSLSKFLNSSLHLDFLFLQKLLYSASLSCKYGIYQDVVCVYVCMYMCIHVYCVSRKIQMEEYAFGNSTNTQTLVNYITTFNNPRRNLGLVRFKIKADGELTCGSFPANCQI